MANIIEKKAFTHAAEKSQTLHNTTRLITAAIMANTRIFVLIFMCQSSAFNLYCSINARTSRLAIFSPSMWADTYELSNSFSGSGLFAHISKLSMHCFAFISFIFFCLFQKKAARVGYGSIISSLSLRLAYAPRCIIQKLEPYYSCFALEIFSIVYVHQLL